MKIKRILSATLAAAMLLCCCILTAFAENETYIGYYNGYSYTCSATCYTYQCKATMATKSNEAMYIRGQIIYKNAKTGKSSTGYVTKDGKGFITTDNLENAISFQSMNATFKVGGHLIETIFVSA